MAYPVPLIKRNQPIIPINPPINAPNTPLRKPPPATLALVGFRAAGTLWVGIEYAGDGATAAGACDAGRLMRYAGAATGAATGAGDAAANLSWIKAFASAVPSAPHVGQATS